MIFIINYVDKIMMLSESEDQSKTKLEMFREYVITKSG